MGPSSQIVQPPGTSYHVRVIGARRTPLRDLYHRFLGVSWPAALASIVAVYLLANALFAVAFHLVGGIANMPEPTPAWAFFFSVQTMGTIGYGAMYPESLGANVLVVVESTTGLVLTALVTGLVFAKFSQPVGRIVFSNNAVISTHEGVPTLTIRVGNERGNRVVEAQVKVDASMTTTTAEGRPFYKTVELPLVRSRMAGLSRAWHVMHVMDAASPLAGLDPEKAAKLELELTVTVVGLDDTTGQTLHGQRIYEDGALRFGHRFADGLRVAEDGVLEIDVSKFHQIVRE